MPGPTGECGGVQPFVRSLVRSFPRLFEGGRGGRDEQGLHSQSPPPASTYLTSQPSQAPLGTTIPTRHHPHLHQHHYHQPSPAPSPPPLTLTTLHPVTTITSSHVTITLTITLTSPPPSLPSRPPSTHHLPPRSTYTQWITSLPSPPTRRTHANRTPFHSCAGTYLPSPAPPLARISPISSPVACARGEGLGCTPSRGFGSGLAAKEPRRGAAGGRFSEVRACVCGEVLCAAEGGKERGVWVVRSEDRGVVEGG